ncbi:NEAT domain-containing protein, partial [Peptoniphilus grossensis]|uniref:NEAT domain-containing protein n=1 Tax=Peptoniphilus grossensis TaxID=1465756 RepID=UPI0009D95F88
MNKIKRIISVTLVGIMIIPSIVSAYSVPQMEAINPINQSVQLRTPANNVEDGIYTAPVEVVHAYNPGQKSMADGAIEHTAKVVYKGDKVTIELTFKGMKLMGMNGHLTNLFFYRDNKDPLNNNDVIEAEVIKSHMDLGLDGNEHNYPQIFRYTMDKSVFEASDFLWIKVWVDAMDAIGSGPGNPIKPGAGEQNAKIVIDKTKFTKVVLNTEALTNEIAAAKGLGQGKKTEESFNTLKAAITSAEEVLNSATEQTAIDEAVTTLKAAVKAFNESADKAVPTPLEKEALTKEIAAAKAIEQGKKTEEAFSKLKAAITSAEEVLNSATDQEALNQGVVALKAAVEEFNNSPDKEASSELVKYVKLNVEDGGPTDPKIRNILDDYAEIVKINEKTYLRLTYFSLEKRSNGLDYGTKQLKYSYDESGEKIEAIGKVIESGQNAGEYELSQIDIPIDGKPEVYLFGEFMASTYNNNKIPGKAIVRFSDSDIQGKTLGNIDKYIVSQKGFTQKEGTEKLEFDVEKDGKIYTPYTSLEKGKFKIINHGSGEIAIKIKRNSFLLGDLRHIKYTLDGTEPTADSKDAGLRNENKPAIGFDKYFAIYLPYEDVESLKETGGDIKVRFKGFNKDFTQSTEIKDVTISFSKESYDELKVVKDESNDISFKADSSREYCFNSTTELKVENIKDDELLVKLKKLGEVQGLSDVLAYKLSFVDNNETAKLDIDKSWNNEKFPLIKIKIEKEGADKNYYKNTAFYEVVNGKLVQLPYNYLIKKASIKNPDSTYIIGQKNYDTQLKEAKEALQNKMNQIETTINGNSLAEINLKNLLEKAKNLGRKTLNNILELNYQIDRNFEIINEGKNSDSEINKGLAKELVKCINSDIYKEIFTKDFYNQVVEIKNELENKLQSGADLKDDLLKLDNLFKDPKYALPYKVTSVEIKRQDRDEPSMAGGCFMEEGKILYGKDENYLLLNLKTMSPGFLNAHLLELSVFKDRIDEDKLDVMSIYKYSDVMSGSSKLGIFDKQILVKLPKIEKDTYFIRVANDGMQGAAPGARLKFTAKGELIEDEPQAPLEKEALTKEIAEAKKIEQGKKTDEAFSKLKAAITAAEETLKNATDQGALDQGVATLKAAVKVFNESADKAVPTPLEKEDLSNEIAAAKAIEQGKKTDEAFSKLQAAIKTAEEILKTATDQETLNQGLAT